MRKFLHAIITVFFILPIGAMGIPATPTFSLHCAYPGAVDCDIINSDSPQIITLNSCEQFINTYRNETPGSGKAWLIRNNSGVGTCLNRIGNLSRRGRGCTLNIQRVSDNMDYLISCNEETSYNITYDSGIAYDTAGRSGLIGVSYAERLCRSTRGRYSNGNCSCGRSISGDSNQKSESKGGQCMCRYIGVEYPSVTTNCAEIARGQNCTATGGSPIAGDTFNCTCPASKHLKVATERTYCECEPEYIFQDPYNRALGCVPKNQTLNINITIKSPDGSPIQGVAATYSNQDGRTQTAQSDSNGTLHINGSVSNTATIRLTKEGYAPAIYSAIYLSSQSSITLQPRATNTYQACLPQSASTGRPGVQVSGGQLYCGDTNEKDCKNGDHVLDTNGGLHKCQNNSWISVNKENAENCVPDNIAVHRAYERVIDMGNQKFFVVWEQPQRYTSDGSSHKSFAINDYCKIDNIETYCAPASLTNQVCRDYKHQSTPTNASQDSTNGAPELDDDETGANHPETLAQIDGLNPIGANQINASEDQQGLSDSTLNPTELNELSSDLPAPLDDEDDDEKSADETPVSSPAPAPIINNATTNADNITITGTVVDAKGPLSGVSVYKTSDNTVGTATDLEGLFTLGRLKSDDEVTFSYVGHEPVTKRVSELLGQNPTIVLNATPTGLDEITIMSQDETPAEATQEEQTPEQTVVQTKPTEEEIAAAQKKLTDAQQKLDAAREKQNSLGNRLVNAGASAATGYGARMVATAMAEQSADAKAESDMREWIDTMKCEYGDGQVFNVGTETIYLPGGDEISEYAKEYKNMAGELKKTKAALGLKPGIESETIYDRADYDLYSYNPAERQSSGNASVSRALMDSTSEDAIAWAEQKQESEQNKKIGTGVAIGGAAVGVIGNTAINTDAIQKIKNAFKKD